MNKKGFTLIELLGVVIILSVIITLVTPRIIEEIKDSNTKTDEYTKKYIIASAERYVKENVNSYPKDDNAVYCIALRKLADLDYVKDPVKLSKVDITDTHSVKLTFTNKFNYEIIETINCRETE